ncbi:MAG: glycosyltransferase [Candidatus Latescibacter sp.]|nr:glycosyltransferase [Candidatus Latescibacter sp.]
MDLSVVIVSYNVSSFLDQTLMTVEESAHGLEYEIFVVDNASADDSVDMVRRKYPQVKLIVNSENRGFAKANNQAFGLAGGRYILLLNPDTVLRSDTIPAMIGFLDRHPEAGAAGCKVINPDGSLQLACRRGFPSPGVAFFKMVGLSGLFPKSRTFGAYNLTYLDPESVSEVDAVSGSFMMLRREALDRAGHLDEDFFMYGEDLDLCYRIKKDGWKIYYVPDTEIIHFKGESTKSVPTMKSILDFYTAMHIFVEKHHGGGTKLFPRWLLITGIYFRMAWGYGIRTLTRLKEPLFDFFLINISLALGVMMRFGVSLEEAPDYTGMQWISIFLVYSTFYMTTFTFLGMYHRYRHNPERAFFGVFIGFLLNVLIVYFIKEYNFSRIASFYCWGFNSIFISGWRFAAQMMRSKETRIRFKKALVVGRIADAAAFRKMVSFSETAPFIIVGCVEVTPGALRGREKDGVYVLGLIDELRDIIKEYAVDMVIMVGSSLPYSKILSIGSKFGSMTPEFKLAPELKVPGENAPNGSVTLIDIHPGGLFGNSRR